ncbi:MAG: glycosyltransferase family 2 protein [Vicinamibacterales bacterium]
MTGPLVSVGIVTWNSAADVPACIAAVRAQTHPSVELLVADNASADDTWAAVVRIASEDERIRFDRNTGFSAAHNALIDRSRGTYYLALNPDVTLDAGYVSHLVAAMESDATVGAATGKLRRAQSNALDSTGIVMLRSQRHLDRGADQTDSGQYERDEDVFGASGAAALYRRAMLEDVRIGREYFDEDFFAYREDADLAWRAQLLGWRCRYVSRATAAHRRVVTPERRSALDAAINRYSVRNRFLLRLKNQTIGQVARFFAPALWRDFQVVAYVLVREHSSLPGLTDVVRLLPRMLTKRRVIMARRRATDADVARWFT